MIAPYDMPRLSLRDISEAGIVVRRDALRKTYICEDAIMHMRADLCPDGYTDIAYYLGVLRDQMLHQRFDFLWTLTTEILSLSEYRVWEGMQLLGGDVSARVAWIIGHITQRGGSFCDWGSLTCNSAAASRYTQSASWMMQHPDGTYDAYEMESTIRGQELAYDEELFGRVRRFLSPTNIKIIQYADIMRY